MIFKMILGIELKTCSFREATCIIKNVLEMFVESKYNLIKMVVVVFYVDTILNLGVI